MYNNVKTNVLEKENVRERQYAKGATNLDKILDLQNADDLKFSAKRFASKLP